MGRITLQKGHVAAKPRLGALDVKFTRVRRSRTRRSVVMSSRHEGQLAGDSRVYSASY